MRKLGLMSFIFSILSCLIIFSIGFSTWYEIDPSAIEAKKEASGAYEAYAVAESTQSGMSINITSVSLFAFSGLSFKTIEHNGEDGALSNFSNSPTGTIEVTYVVGGATIPEDGTFTVNVALGHSGASKTTLFKDAFATAGNSYTVKVNGADLTDKATIDSADKITFSHTFTDGVKDTDYTFTVVYTFNIPSSTTTDPLNFRNSFGKHIIGSDGDNTTTGLTPTKFVATATATQG